MNNDKREFDHFSESYEELLNDPIRDRFSPGGTEFFHIRKRDLIREYFQRRQIDTKKLAYLDLGCGKGELATLLRSDMGSTSRSGCSCWRPRRSPACLDGWRDPRHSSTPVSSLTDPTT